MKTSLQTTADFLNNHLTISHYYDDKTDKMVCLSEQVEKAMVEFARFHVTEALKEVSEIKESEEYGKFYVDKDSILNAYPLNNIK